MSLGLDWCGAVVEGAAFTAAWQIFASWNELPRAYTQLVSRVRGLLKRTKPPGRR
jgi:hypothetical protein